MGNAAALRTIRKKADQRTSLRHPTPRYAIRRPTHVTHPKTHLRTAAVGLTAAVALLAACAAARKEPQDEVRHAIYHGEYDQAVRDAARLRQERPDDPELERLHRDATVAWLLEQGRRATFEDLDEDALVSFRRALELDPSSIESRAWIDKTVRKLSRIWLERGLELHASGKLEAAVEAYEKALAYVPGDPSALNGMGEAVIQINYRAGMGKDYFEAGLQALSKYWLEQARARFAYAGKYQPKEPKTHQRKGQVDELLAQQRVTVAKGLETDGRFAAAKNEFRFAVALDSENKEAAEGLARCTDEARAAELLAQSKMEIIRKRFDKAASKLEEGEALTKSQGELFDGARAQIEQARFEEVYETALALERDFQYEKAVETYTALLSDTEYFKDALARKETLEEYIGLAKDLYEKAAAAATDEERAEDLRKIRVFWPEYKDVAEQLARLEKKEP